LDLAGLALGLGLVAAFAFEATFCFAAGKAFFFFAFLLAIGGDGLAHGFFFANTNFQKNAREAVSLIFGETAAALFWRAQTGRKPQNQGRIGQKPN
jgi:hypothetical protein